MKLIDKYIDGYFTHKVVHEIENALMIFNIDEKLVIKKDYLDGYCIDILVKLREENDEQYMWVCRVSAKRATYLLCNIEKANKEIIKRTKQVLKEKHERLGR